MSDKPKRILFIGPSCVGDVVMATPVLQSLHKIFLQSSLDVVADARSSELYTTCPYVNQIYIKDKGRLLRGAVALLGQLWKTRYDVIVDVRTDGLAYLLRARKRYTKMTAKPYGPHAAQTFMGVIASLHGNNTISKTCLWLKQAHHNYAQRVLSAFKDRRQILAISISKPGAPCKNLLADTWVQFINENKGCFSGVVFIGGPDDQIMTNQVKTGVTLPHIDIIGCSLLETAATLKEAALFIGPDSGPGHLAGAVGTTTITLFSTDKQERCRPWGGEAIVVQGKDNDARNIMVADMNNAVKQALKL